MNKQLSAGKWRDLGTRAGVALALAPVVLFCIWKGGAAFTSLLALVSALMVFEWCRLIFSQPGATVQMGIHGAAIAGMLIALCYSKPLIGILFAIVFWLLSVVWARRDDEKAFPWAYYGVPYLVLPMAALFMLRTDPTYGLMATIWLIAVIWATDIGAYFAGRIIGGPKLAPRFSPKKTWAGLVGGAMFAAIASFGVALYFNIYPRVGLSVFAAFVAAFSQAGDIFESAAKRHFGVKDSSNILPGHGGILDRVDGLVFAAVLCAAFGLVRGGFDAPAKGLMAW